MIIANAAAWAIVMWVGACSPSSDEGNMCQGRLVSGLVWGTREQCAAELRENPQPGAECREIVSLVDPDVYDEEPEGMEDVLRSLNEAASEGATQL